jgi:predicted nucleotidyltransferase
VSTVKNPNDIVDEYVADYKSAFGENLACVIMYGSAVTHEYRPGDSDINTLIVLKNFDLGGLTNGFPVVRKWLSKKVTIPFYMTGEYIASSLDTYPIEFIDIRSNYKVLFGEDVLARLDFKKEHVRLQCERELKGIALHLRREFIRTNGNRKALARLLNASIKTLLPVFKALLVLNDRTIPKLKSDIIMAVEELFNLGISVFTELLVPKAKPDAGRSLDDIINQFAKTIDMLIATVNQNISQRGK